VLCARKLCCSAKKKEMVQEMDLSLMQF